VVISGQPPLLAPDNTLQKTINNKTAAIILSLETLIGLEKNP